VTIELGEQPVRQRRPRRNGDPTAAAGTVPARLDSQETLRLRFPARPAITDWPATRASVDQIVAELAERHPGRNDNNAARRARGVRLALSWLAEQPGMTWQQRWQASGVEQRLGRGWVELPLAHFASQGLAGQATELLLRRGVQLLACLDVIRPGMVWLFARRSQRLGAAMALLRDPDGFATVADLCQSRFAASPYTRSAVAFRLAVILAAKGGAIADITVGDYVEAVEAQEAKAVKHATNGTMTITYELLRAMGVFGADVPATVRVFRKADRLGVEQMLDRRGIACRPIRDLLVAYLHERVPRLDYTTLVNMEVVLAKLFWRDLERHHPGIASLDLPADVAAAWKQRMQFKTATVVTDSGEVAEVRTARKTFKDRLITVRGFYLDIAQWAAEDPARWAQWVAPCPIRPGEIDLAKEQRRRKAAMDQRTRERLPVLPLLARTVNQRRLDAAERLDTARGIPDGAEFTVGGQTLRRVSAPRGGSHRVWAHDPAMGRRRDLTAEESHTFWAWATVEVLRHSGVRVEELLELSHHSFVQYRLPTTAELVPLLQIVPSKTDTERLLLVSPELADVLAAVVSRLRDPTTGAIPLVASYDPLERTWREPQPLLFQYRHNNENRAVSRQSIARFLNDALAVTGLHDSAGAPLRFTAHDFRRVFITDAILNGLPPHIAQVLCGHRDINTTMGYKAAYPAEAIEAHRAFLSRRRALRPSSEYRTPSDTEWQEFLGHFERRKVSLGTCARAFGTPCIHEHSCIRCSMLWPDPAQRDRLVEIRDNLIARITEAERENWLGEVEGLRISLASAEDKLNQIDQAAAARSCTTNQSGVPDVSNVVAVTITTRRPDERSP
jgi:integrase